MRATIVVISIVNVIMIVVLILMIFVVCCSEIWQSFFCYCSSSAGLPTEESTPQNRLIGRALATVHGDVLDCFFLAPRRLMFPSALVVASSLTLVVASCWMLDRC